LKIRSIEDLIISLMKTCGFGDVISPIKHVSGGFLHRMYKVVTECGTYAVKCLNPEIMGREGVLDNYERAERMECILEKEDIPIVPAIIVNGKKKQEIGGQYFYIFHWQEGQITDWNNISVKQCNIAGKILGRIHAIAPQKGAHKEPEMSHIDWHEYLRTSNEQNSEIATVLADNLQLLIDVEKELNRARRTLPDLLCISNEDMDPKNIMWNDGKPYVIDLECLDYGNPVSHVLQLSLQWSGITTCNMDVEKMAAFINGYLGAYDNGFRAYGDVFGLAYTWVDWLEYNIRRALGTCVDEEERIMGISEVRNTVDRIKYIRSMEEEIKEVFDNL